MVCEKKNLISASLGCQHLLSNNKNLMREDKEKKLFYFSSICTFKWYNSQNDKYSSKYSKEFSSDMLP
jgi:hypothetical protein